MNELVAPRPESVRHVKDWLAAHGLYEEDLSYSPAGDWIKVAVPVSLAEDMLDAVSCFRPVLLDTPQLIHRSQQYHTWEHHSGDTLVRATSYSVPAHLHDHVEFVQPTTLFSRFRGMATTSRLVQSEASSAAAVTDAPAIPVPSASNGQVDASCNSTITITCLKQLYNAVGYTPQADTGNQFAVTAYLEQFANVKDLQLFFADQVPSAVGSSFEVISINGGFAAALCDSCIHRTTQGEKTSRVCRILRRTLVSPFQTFVALMLFMGHAIDTQFGYGMVFPTPATFYTTGGSPPSIPDSLNPTNTNEPYLDVSSLSVKT